ncbi:DUF4178 domain-containing protein [Jannaschia sp. Os4]|uniref:DUF4178 domain-containing protein n=1 Tax=Jannaschia sp. Os4 TaxID=2807617 RepID=UPI00193A8B63|nr:DUF4178 domain-containing protein [Jannaschia sp. Os4]MBM2577783.1 DUF4178 domain-containing protein [Jannaschia sp. Os4]
MDRSCPNCGAALPELLAHARMVSCAFCGTSVVLDGAVVENAGSSGEMLDAPELIRLGGAVSLAGRSFEAAGHVRYDYGRGHWDEYHGLLDGEPAWVSVDEGDMAIQHALDPGLQPRGGRALFRLGAEVEVGGRSYRATEVENATLVAYRGQLPEPMAVGEVHLYANFTGPGGAILSGESWPGGEAWFVGEWIDPFEVTG